MYIWAPFSSEDPLPYLKTCLIHMAKSEAGGWWPSLAETLDENMGQEDHGKNLRCLKLLSKLTKKYEEESRSDPLYKEIIDVINIFHDKFLFLVQGYINACSQKGI